MNTKRNGLRWVHQAVLLACLDTLVILISYFLALLLRFDLLVSHIPPEYIQGYLWSMPYWIVSTIVVFYICRLYHSIWRLVSIAELRMIITAFIILAAVYAVGMMALHLRMPRSYYFIGYLISCCLTTGVRFSYRILRFYINHVRQDEKKTERIMIIGAGVAGHMLIKELLESDKVNVKVCCVIDDNPEKKGRLLEGIPIVGNRYDIVAMVEKYRINRIIYAIPTTTGKNRKDILNLCKGIKCQMQTVPGIYQLVNGEVSVSQLRDVEVTDLLGRAQVRVNNEEIFESIKGKTVMVTGGEALSAVNCAVRLPMPSRNN